MTKKEIKKILKEHKLWLAGLGGTRADLHDVDLRGVNLRGVDLSYANLHNAILNGVNLSKVRLNGTDLSNVVLNCAILYDAVLNNANLSGANLAFSDLRNSELEGVNLYGACLRTVDLNGADLRHSDLSYTDLRYANLRNTKLDYANLYNANLHNANLTGADLYNVNLNGANKSIEFRNGKVLLEPLTGYKKCKGGVIVTLEIPEGAIVFSINGDKCRTNKVKVLAIDGADVGISFHDGSLYHVGDEITISNFDCRYNVECSTGIHFFIDRKDAETYMF